MRAATTHSAGTTLFTFPALKWTITTIQGVAGEPCVPERASPALVVPVCCERGLSLKNSLCLLKAKVGPIEKTPILRGVGQAKLKRAVAARVVVTSPKSSPAPPA